MKLKKIIIKHYDKNFGVFKNPCYFIHNFYESKSFKFIFIINSFRRYRKSLILLIYKNMNIRKLIKAFGWDRTKSYSYAHTFLLTTSSLVHSFLFYTFFYKMPFVIAHDFEHKIDKLETEVYNSKMKIMIKPSYFKNFYYPFIYFLAFKSLKYKP